MESVHDTINGHVNGWMGALKEYFGMTDTMAMLCLIAAIVVVGAIFFYVVRPIMLSIVERMAKRERAVWIRAAHKNHVFHRIAWFIPGLVALLAEPVIIDSTLPLAPSVAKVVLIGSEIYLVLVGAAVISALINSVQTRMMSYQFAHRYSIKSYIQVLKIILFSLTAIVVVAILIGRSPMYLLTGLGAMTAVGMLVFKDSILGFVASIQVAAYDVIRVGDWVEIRKFGADGTVIDISLNTIKIQNFDKTIVTIPSYTLLSEGVVNWRGMSESGGRRIKRHITVNNNSVKLCDSEMIERLCQLPLLKKRLEQYLQNEHRHVDADAMKLAGADPRSLTNMTLYRLYVEAYLRSHPRVNASMSFLVRELQDDNYGIPLQIYIFLNTVVWADYEAIQADIFDYLYSVMSIFDLDAYQYESETIRGYLKGDS